MPNLYHLRSSIYSQLAPLTNAGLRVRFMPDRVNQIGEPGENGWVTIALTTFHPSERPSLNHAATEYRAKFKIEILSTSRYLVANSQELTFTGDTLEIGTAIAGLTIDSQDGSARYTEGTDYTVSYDGDLLATVTRESEGAIAANATVQVSYTTSNTGTDGAITLLTEYLNGFRPTGASAPIKLGPFTEQTRRDNHWVVFGEFEVMLAGKLTIAGIQPAPLGDGISLVLLDSDYDSDINLPIPTDPEP